MTRSAPERIFRLTIPLVILLFPLLMKAPAVIPLVPGGHGFGGDAVNTMYPWVTTSARMIAAGELPIWTPYEGLGRPLYSNIQAAAFYPPTWLLAFISQGEPGFWLFHVYLLLHLGWGGLGVYALAREMGQERLAALLAALVFQGGGFFVGHISMLSIIASLVWVPWMLYTWLRSLQGGQLYWWAGFGMCAAMSLLGGQPQPAYYGLVIIGVHGLYSIISKGSPRPLWVILTAGLISFCLAAPVLIPGFRELPELVRGQEGWQQSGHLFASLPAQLAAMLAPHAADALPGAVAYSFFFGAGALALMLPGITSARGRGKALLVTASAVSALFAFSEALGLAGLLSAVLPGFGFFKEHYRAGALLLICVAIFAGWGFHHVSSSITRWRLRFVVPGAALIIALNLWFLLSTPAPTYDLRLSLLLIASAGAVGIISWLPAARKYRLVILLFAVAETLHIGLSHNMHRGMPERVEQRRQLAAAVPAGIAPPRITWGPDYSMQTLDVAFGLNTLHSWDANQYRSLRRLWQMMERQPRLYRRYGLDYWRHVKPVDAVALPEDELMLHPDNQFQRFQLAAGTTGRNIEVRVDDAAAPAKLTAAVALGTGQIISMKRSRRNDNGVVFNLALQNPAAIKSIGIAWKGSSTASLQTVTIDGQPAGLAPLLQPVAESVYALTDSLPKAYLVPRVRTVKQPAQIVPRIVNSQDIDEVAYAVEDKQLPEIRHHWRARDFLWASASLERYSPTNVVLAVEAPTEAMLVLNDYYHPCWKAEVDGKPVAVWRVNFAVRGVVVPEGSSEIRFYYDDPLMTAGILCWWTGIILAGTLIITGIVRQPGTRG